MTSEILEKRVRLLLLTTRHEPRDVLPWRAGKIGRSVLDGLQLWDPQRPGCPQNRRPGTNVANRTADDGSGNRAHDADGGIPGVAPDGSNTPTPGIRRGPSKARRFCCAAMASFWWNDSIHWVPRAPWCFVPRRSHQEKVTKIRASFQAKTLGRKCLGCEMQWGKGMLEPMWSPPFSGQTPCIIQQFASWKGSLFVVCYGDTRQQTPEKEQTESIRE